MIAEDNKNRSVGLLTMHRVTNCGSQLQAYALQRVVNALGYDCKVIDYEYPSLFHYSRKMDKGNLKSVKGVIKKILNALGLLRLVQGVNIWRFNLQVRRQMREGFQGVKLTRAYNISSIKRHPPRFDIYLIGSDQVWNPDCIVGDYTFLLDFAPECVGRVAYSASFGVRELPREYNDEYAGLLRRFSAIGVRESSGAEIVRRLTGQDAVPVLDPTMLLTADDWKRYAAPWVDAKRKYVFCYVLSYVFKASPWIMGYARRVADMLGCEVVFYGGGESDCIEDARKAGFEVLEQYIAPQRLVRYYLDAEYVIATGFHGTALAITLGKALSIVVNPNPTLDDRVVSLANRMGLESRCVVCGADYEKLDLSWLRERCDIDEDCKLAAARADSLAFLRRALAEA